MFKLLPFHLFRCEGAYQKIDAISKGHTIRQVLSGSVFLNFHHLHPEFQKFILLRIQTHYCSKKDIQSDVTFFMVMSVSVVSNTIHTACIFWNLLWLPVFFFFLFPATLVVHFICILGDWNWLPHSIFWQWYRKISSRFLPTIQEMGPTRLPQS